MAVTPMTKSPFGCVQPSTFTQKKTFKGTTQVSDEKRLLHRGHSRNMSISPASSRFFMINGGSLVQATSVRRTSGMCFSPGVPANNLAATSTLAGLAWRRLGS